MNKHHHIVRITTKKSYLLESYATRSEALRRMERCNHRVGVEIYRDGATGQRYSEAECLAL